LRFSELLTENTIGPVFHGTEREFESFKTGMPSASGVQSSGFFFTKSLNVAKGYGDNVIAATLDMEDWVEFDFHGKSRVYFDGKNRSPSELVNRISEINDDLENGYGLPDEDESDIVYELEDAGWEKSFGLDIIDGIVMNNVDDSMTMFDGEITTHFVVFNAGQIKNIRKL
jgi:hypothetical protein